jgi:hypothetical protein
MSGFLSTLHAEWTKLRTLPGFVIGIIAAGGLIAAFGLLPGMQGSCGTHGPGSQCVVPTGPDGTEVRDAFTFVNRQLSGDGSITVRVTGLAAQVPGPGPYQLTPAVVPWAKAGLIIKDGTGSGSSYAAVMLTAAHGVRMQYDYTHDIAGGSGTGPTWLGISRAGDTITGSESADGATWTVVGTVRLAGLPATATAGLFVTSPDYVEEAHDGVLSGAQTSFSEATGRFDNLTVQGGWSGADWRTDQLGSPGNMPPMPGTKRDGDTFAVTGSGDIAPAVPGAAGLGTTVTQTLAGTFIGLILAVVVGALFFAGEYRRGMVRTTFAASPGRVRVLAAKALVIGAATFVTGLVAAAVVVVFGQRVLQDNGVYVHHVSTMTEVRIVLGTAALLAVSSIFALGLGTLVRRSSAAVAVAVVGIVLPYLLTMTVLPVGPADWVLRISPAAAFAVQQAAQQYKQVINVYTPAAGYFPLSPWAGLAVLVGWAVLALGGAALALRGRDA